MNHRRLFKRIQNLDRLYLLADQFIRAASDEQDQEARDGLRKIADRFDRRYRKMVNDRRLTSA